MKRNNRVRLTEAQLHRVIKESVKRIVKENGEDRDPIEDEEYWSGHGYCDDPHDSFSDEEYNELLKLLHEWFDFFNHAKRIETNEKNVQKLKQIIDESSIEQLMYNLENIIGY